MKSEKSLKKSTENLRSQSASELQETLSTALRSQFKRKLSKTSGDFVHIHKLREERREIARILTILNEKRKGESND